MDANQLFEHLMYETGGDFILSLSALEDGAYLSKLDVSQDVVEEVYSMLKSDD